MNDATAYVCRQSSYQMAIIFRKGIYKWIPIHVHFGLHIVEAIQYNESNARETNCCFR